MKAICEAYIFYSENQKAWFALARRSDTQNCMCGVDKTKLDAIARIRALADDQGYHWPKHVAFEEAPPEVIADTETAYDSYHKRIDRDRYEKAQAMRNANILKRKEEERKAKLEGRKP